MSDDDPAGERPDPVIQMQLLVGDDLVRWSKIGMELEHRKDLFGEHRIHAAESLLRDVQQGWI